MESEAFDLKDWQKFISILLGFCCILGLLAGCSQKEALPEENRLAYSLSSSVVENSPVETHTYDLSFLLQENQMILDCCWVDTNRLLCLTASQNNEAAEENLPSEIRLYMLYKGDSTLELIHQGEQFGNQLQKLPQDKVAILSAYSITVFDYNRNQIVNELEISNDEESGNHLALSPNGSQIVYGDENGVIHLVDEKNENIGQLEPRDLGYNFLSNPIWSKDGNYIACFCGYEPYSYDDIAIAPVDELDNAQALNYEASEDFYPVWPDQGDHLLVLHNFYNNPDNLPRSLSVLNPDNGNEIKTIALDNRFNSISLIYADTSTDIYYFVCDQQLYRQQGGQAAECISPQGLQVYSDMVRFLANGQKCCILANDTAGNISSLYVLEFD